jgi:hypothetical protein
MFFFESVYSLLFSADAPAQPEPRPEPQPESQPESVRDSLEPEFVLPSERVRKWVASTFALDYHCHEDTLRIAS